MQVLVALHQGRKLCGPWHGIDQPDSILFILSIISFTPFFHKNNINWSISFKITENANTVHSSLSLFLCSLHQGRNLCGPCARNWSARMRSITQFSISSLPIYCVCRNWVSYRDTSCTWRVCSSNIYIYKYVYINYMNIAKVIKSKLVSFYFSSLSIYCVCRNWVSHRDTSCTWRVCSLILHIALKKIF